MNLPIQASPIDRAARTAKLNAVAASPGIRAQQIHLGKIGEIACEACALLPFPLSLACRTICKVVID